MSGRRARLVREAYALASCFELVMKGARSVLREYRETGRWARKRAGYRRSVLALAMGPSDLYPDRVRPEWLTLRRDRRHDG